MIKVSNSVDVAKLFKLRLIIARYGEMDINGWWNTKGMLGKYGEIALKRGLPRTHYFAQARVVFEVAKKRCDEYLSLKNCIHLWALPTTIEDDFDRCWFDWLDKAKEWQPFFESIREIGKESLENVLKAEKLIVANRTKDKVSKGEKGLFLGEVEEVGNDHIEQMAWKFSLGEKEQLVVPYFKQRK